MSDTPYKRPRLPVEPSASLQDYSGLQLKQDHAKKPLWVCPDGRIFLECHSPIYTQITDFLIAISEPVSRPQHIHEYMITKYSLYSAASVKLEFEYIISVLRKHCKTVDVPEPVVEFIRKYTEQYGKAKLVLQGNRYFIESAHIEVLETLQELESVRRAKIVGVESVKANDTGDVDDGLRLMMDEDPSDLQRFEINPQSLARIREECESLNYPLIEEYDFLNDSTNPRLAIDLKPTTHIRSYQEKSLSKMFSNGRARSGVIVLPCGAGKTLVGITGICTIKKRAIVLCTSGVAVDQWRDQLLRWSTIDPSLIIRFTSGQKDAMFDKDTAGVLISTYSMMGYSGNRSEGSLDIFEKLRQIEWGLLIMDEVQVVPANMFRKVIFEVNSHCKLGLTATLVREDDKIEDLNFLIGPKLYEANWMDLQSEGLIAKVQCKEVWCPMTAEFFQEYLLARPARKIQLYVANPNKLMVCQYLVRMHENNNDKIIIFSDNLCVLELYGQYMGLRVISGRVPEAERKSIFQQFNNSPMCRTVLVSKVGDNSIDLPEANVIIQISSHFGSRRQEAQRLGRILRPKVNMIRGEYNAFFYSLVSQDTQEMSYANKRQQFLIDQGYAYEVMKATPEMFEGDLKFKSKEEQKALLERILQAREDTNDVEEDTDASILNSQRKSVELSSLSRPRTSEIPQPRNKLFLNHYKPTK